VVLGDRGGRRRCLLVWASGTSLLGALALLLLPSAAHGWVALGSPARAPLDQVLADLAAVVLLACTTWAWLALTATVLEAARGVDPARRGPWHLPRGVRRCVLAACGLALAAGTSPALADDLGHHHHHHGAAQLIGLPLPDRAALPARGPGHRPQVVEVVPGDTLWAIAARDLAADASDALIGARWQAIYAANRAVIGPDPDVIEPGQRLRLPRTHPRSLPGEDPS
jgi:hypothetical protein